jgi:hypothetical protein
VFIQEKNHLNVTSATKHSEKDPTFLPINAFIQEKDHLNVTSVIKHFMTVVAIVNIEIYILEKDHLNVTNATKHSEKNPTLLSINVFIQEKEGAQEKCSFRKKTYKCEFNQSPFINTKVYLFGPNVM